MKKKVKSAPAASTPPEASTEKADIRAVSAFIDQNLFTHLDQVDHPDHYRQGSGHEAIDVIEAWDLGFCLGNAVKYICRAGRHESDKAHEDIEKAIWYLNRALSEEREF